MLNYPKEWNWILQKPEIHRLLQDRQTLTGTSVLTRAMLCLWSMPLGMQKSNPGLISSCAFFCACPYTQLCLISRGAFQAQLSVNQHCAFLSCVQAFGPSAQWNLMTSSFINVLHIQRLLGCTYQWHFPSSLCQRGNQHCILPLPSCHEPGKLCRRCIIFSTALFSTGVDTSDFITI